MANWPTLPTLGNTTESRDGLLRSLKNVLEMMLGQRGGAPAPIPVVYRGYFMPGSSQSTVPRSQLKDGDLFIDLSNNYKLNFWDGPYGLWRPTS